MNACIDGDIELVDFLIERCGFDFTDRCHRKNRCGILLKELSYNLTQMFDVHDFLVLYSDKK